MKRRRFLWKGGVLTTGLTLVGSLPGLAEKTDQQKEAIANDLYELFKNPPAIYHPFVRWWWNGDKIEKAELIRELHLMKEAGIGGVEINPIKFPARTDDMGRPSLRWLSPEWIDRLQTTLEEAKKLGITCDLIVGSGWPFGAEYLEGEERSSMVVIGTKKLEGPLEYEVSEFSLFKEADPAISAPYSGRTMEIMQLKLVPELMNNLEEAIDLSSMIGQKSFRIKVPEGKYVLYALIKIRSFMEVINGAPGADGPVLNHYNKEAVKKYLNHMSDTIQARTGPLSKDIRAFFTDSMELEGANWTVDMAEEFKKRRGYDLMLYLPFTMYKVGSMGNTFDYTYGAAFGPALNDTIQRVRYDFELTKTELLEERFIQTFVNWCKTNTIKSRAQAYGRGYFPLEGSFDMDIPECETWIKYGLGGEVNETNYRFGRAHTMINKFVSSAAHLKGKRLVSCEELTNTDMVFNDTLEILKVGGDQSTISGVTHPVFHGFNYSPPDAAFPGWVRYGTYFNEKNTWWPYFKYFTTYKARFSALFQQADMFADIAILPPVADMWAQFSAQNEPFPLLTHPDYQLMIWESMNRTGNACDYVSEKVIRDAQISKGKMLYGPRSYHTIFLLQVESLEPATAQKLLDFVIGGGRIFCIETIPGKSPGLSNYQQRDLEVKNIITKLQQYPDRFILIKKPTGNFLKWYQQVQQQYAITPYVKMDNPNQYVTQARYQAEGIEMLLFINSNMENGYDLTITPSKEMTTNRQAWSWDADTGERYQLNRSGENILLTLGPADAQLIVFDKLKKGKPYQTLPVSGKSITELSNRWEAEFRHIDGTVKQMALEALKDLKDMPDLVSFSGTILYRTKLQVTDLHTPVWLNLGKVLGVSELTINGKPAGVKWYGHRIYPIGLMLHIGSNEIEVKVTTSMGNYMKTLKNNEVAQYWTNLNRKNQPVQSMGLIGPVTCYG